MTALNRTMPFVVVGLSHRSCSVSVRERCAIPETAAPGALAKLRGSGTLEEAVVVSTCNRVEIYGVTALRAEEAGGRLREFLNGWGGGGEPLSEALYELHEPESVKHLFRVASGLDSMVLGETEILGQIKKAYDQALREKQTGPRVNRLFQGAFNVAKQIRTETGIQRGSVSVGSVAVELAEKIFNSLRDRHVLVIGAGDTSEKTARFLSGRGARDIWVTNRSHDRAVALAEALAGRAVPFDDWTGMFERVDIVISSTAAPNYVLDRKKLAPLMKQRRHRPLLLIDIAVPRDIEPEVNFLENIYLYNIDDLQSIAEDYLKRRREEISRCEAIIAQRAKAALAGLSDLAPRRKPAEERGAVESPTI